MHIWDQSLRAQEYIILRRSLGQAGQVTKVPCQAPHITIEYYADIRNRTPRAKVNLHIQKPKPQARIKNKIEKIHKLFDVYGFSHKHDLPSGMRWFFKEKNSSAFGTVYYLNQDNRVPYCPNSYAPLHARRQGQTLAEFKSPKPQNKYLTTNKC